jgi:uncharacterized protein
MEAGEAVGGVHSLWRFPVKSMLGEELESAEVTEGGVLGDRSYAIVDRETGKVASAKHPKLWPDLPTGSGARSRSATRCAWPSSFPTPAV